MTRLLRFFRPSHQHTAFSATLLLMSAVMLSRVIGYVREAYIAYAFGAEQQLSLIHISHTAASASKSAHFTAGPHPCMVQV